MNLIKVEKSLYQPNRTSYMLCLLAIILNTYYVIIVLNIIDKDLGIGISILFNIFMSLLLFLSAVRLKIYSKTWAIIVIIFGIFQVIRGFIGIPEEIVDQRIQLTIIVIISGLLLFFSGIYGLHKSLLQIKYRKHHKAKSGILK